MKYEQLLVENAEYHLPALQTRFQAKMLTDRGRAFGWLLLNLDDGDNHLWVTSDGTLAEAYYKGGPVELKAKHCYIIRPGYEPDTATVEDLKLCKLPEPVVKDIVDYLAPGAYVPDTQGADLPGVDTPPTGIDIQALIKHVRHIRDRADSLLAVQKTDGHTLNPTKEAAALTELAIEISNLSWDLAHASAALWQLQGVSGALLKRLEACREIFGTDLPCQEDVLVYMPGDVGDGVFTRSDKTADAEDEIPF